MVLQGRPGKRHSFSVESLAVSSRVPAEDSRDTDSPYLNYLRSAADHAANDVTTVDCNANYAHKAWPTQFTAGPSTIFEHVPHVLTPALTDTATGTDVNRILVPTAGGNTHVTSTPKEPCRKRRRSCESSTPPSSDESRDSMSTSGDMDKLSPASSTSGSSDGGDMDEAGGKRKKARTAFSGEQLRELEGRYKAQKYLTASDRLHLARSLKLKDQQVKTWFQNRRMKEKRQQRDDEQTHGFCLPTGGVDISQLAALGIFPPPYGYPLASPAAATRPLQVTPPAISPVLTTPPGAATAYNDMQSLRSSTDLSTAIHRPIPSTLPQPDFPTNTAYPGQRSEHLQHQASLISPPSRQYLNQPPFGTDSLPVKATLPVSVAIAATAAGLSQYSHPYLTGQAPVPYMQYFGQHY